MIILHSNEFAIENINTCSGDVHEYNIEIHQTAKQFRSLSVTLYSGIHSTKVRTAAHFPIILLLRLHAQINTFHASRKLLQTIPPLLFSSWMPG